MYPQLWTAVHVSMLAVLLSLRGIWMQLSQMLLHLCGNEVYPTLLELVVMLWCHKKVYPNTLYSVCVCVCVCVWRERKREGGRERERRGRWKREIVRGERRGGFVCAGGPTPCPQYNCNFTCHATVFLDVVFRILSAFVCMSTPLKWTMYLPVWRLRSQKNVSSKIPICITEHPPILPCTHLSLSPNDVGERIDLLSFMAMAIEFEVGAGEGLHAWVM